MPGGNLVQLSNLRIEGARPDGSVMPGADIAAIVDFDPSGAGCDESTKYCTPGAVVQWYINGQLFQESVASGYNGSLGGYSVAIGLLAPSSGAIDISVVSSNQLDASLQVVATGYEPGEGTVSVHDVVCGNSPYYNCCCEANGSLLVYYARDVVNIGSGTAYVNVLVDGVLVVENQPTSTAGGDGMDSVVISCPGRSADHEITVAPRYGTGASVTLRAGTPLGGDYSPGGAAPTLIDTDVAGPISEAALTPVTLGQIPQVLQLPQVKVGGCQGMFRDGNFDVSCATEPENVPWIVGGAVVIAAVGILMHFAMEKGQETGVSV